MALNPNPVGKSVADYIIANKPADGTPVSPAQLESLWQGIMNLIYNDIKASAVVNTNDTGTVTSGPGAGGAVVATGVGTVT